MKEVQNVVHVAISHCPFLLSDSHYSWGMMSRRPLSNRSSCYFILPFVPKYEVSQIDTQMFQKMYVSYSSKKAT